MEDIARKIERLGAIVNDNNVLANEVSQQIDALKLEIMNRETIIEQVENEKAHLQREASTAEGNKEELNQKIREHEDSLSELQADKGVLTDRLKALTQQLEGLDDITQTASETKRILTDARTKGSDSSTGQGFGAGLMSAAEGMLGASSLPQPSS